MNRGFTGLRYKYISLHPDEITKVKQMFENGIIQSLILSGADLITIDVHLDPPCTVLDFSKRSFTHDTAGHIPAGYTYILEILFFRIKFFYNSRCISIDRVQFRWIRVDAQVNDFLQVLSPYYLLL